MALYFISVIATMLHGMYHSKHFNIAYTCYVYTDKYIAEIYLKKFIIADRILNLPTGPVPPTITMFLSLTLSI